MSEQKLIVVGVDGMDPRFTKYMLDSGECPNIRRIYEEGAQREDLRMLGGLPTITPPMWTTLATGATPATHGITCFWNQDHEDLSGMVYSLDSTMCKAEQVWNVLAESGKKTLVWHWPGSSWPPSSQSENLHVVDGTQPGYINFGTAMKEEEVLITASTEAKELIFKAKGGTANTGAGCLISDVDVKDEDAGASTALEAGTGSSGKVVNVMLELEDGDFAIELANYDVCTSPLKPAKNWANAPEGALEFTILHSESRLRRPCLFVKDGDTCEVRMYKSKKDEQPLTVMPFGEFTDPVVDEIITPDGEHVECFRSYKFFYKKEENGEITISIWGDRAFKTVERSVWHPKRLHDEVFDNVGYFTTGASMGGRIAYFTEELMVPSWDKYLQWQAKAMNHLIEKEGYQAVFSHVHNVDGIGHNVWPHVVENDHTNPEDIERNKESIREVYRQTDRYIGEFMHLLDEGWNIVIVSDHGLSSGEELAPALMGDPFGVNAAIMDDLGFTVLKRDENNNRLKEIDWEKTKAVATRGNHIWINLKGKYDTGIVDPEDKWQVEEDIINALNAYRDPRSGRRIISLILRNKEAEIIGMNGEECGDLVYFLEEGFNRVHGDSISTNQGAFHTSVSPIFMAIGPAFKSGVKTDRVIRETDVAPTIATVFSTRMPAQCEGAPVYQIINYDNLKQ